MKTSSRIAKACLLVVAITSGIVLSSFTGTKETAGTTGLKNYEEYYKVRDFVQEKICSVIRKQKPASGKMSSFSRCPSGYESQIAGELDSVKVDHFTYGKINLYKGCSPTYVCDFKVCMSKGFAEVKSKGMKDYMSVEKWLEETSTKKTDPSPSPEKPKEVKG
ncbi:MAG: hypothetical protein H0W61_08610 [Bacteroidetes bacterium]|nr:hypothetical protein [Bacteroidota bacterium]